MGIIDIEGKDLDKKEPEKQDKEASVLDQLNTLAQKAQSQKSTKGEAEKKGRGRPRKNPDPEPDTGPDVNEMIMFFSPAIVHFTNVVFDRLNWRELDKREGDMLTDASVRIAYKYMPWLFEHFSEEINFLFVVSIIVFMRMDFKKKAKEETIH